MGLAKLTVLGLVASASAYSMGAARPATARAAVQQRAVAPAMTSGLKSMDLTGKVAFVAGVADSTGYGWAIAKALASAGCKIVVGTWPPVLGIFEKSLKAGKFDDDMILDDGSKMVIEKIYPLDAVYDAPEDVPEDVKSNKRYAGLDGFTIQECADKVKADYGKIDFFIHSLDNGPEVAKPLLETSRKGYLAAASASSYSLVSCVAKFGPIMNEGGSFLSLGFIAAAKTVPGYGGGMSSAKAQLESDTRVLAWEAGRVFKVRVNCVSAGPLKSRAATAINKDDSRTFIEMGIDYYLANAPLQKNLYSDDIGEAAACLLSPAMGAVTGVCLYVDNGMHAMGQAREACSKPLFERTEVLTPEECLGSGAIRGDGQAWDAPYA